MASEKITAIVESVKTMTVLELKELVDTICEEFGVSAVAACAADSAGNRPLCRLGGRLGGGAANHGATRALPPIAAHRASFCRACTARSCGRCDFCLPADGTAAGKKRQAISRAGLLGSAADCLHGRCCGDFRLAVSCQLPWCQLRRAG